MADTVQSVSILTYHSISNEPGPTSIAPEIFAAQMQAVRHVGVDVAPLSHVEEWHAGKRDFKRRTIAITFDDAFRDFAQNAFPVLRKMGFPATVFVPTSVVGGKENWGGANPEPRALMNWDEIRRLAAAGVTFGSHTRTHCDLTTLPPEALEAELTASRKELEESLGRPAPHFAPPYGRSNPLVREAIARHYSLSVGVALNHATRESPANDLPRIEMHYYRDIGRWRDFLEGRGAAYFSIRRAARGLRAALTFGARRPAYQD